MTCSSCLKNPWMIPKPPLKDMQAKQATAVLVSCGTTMSKAAREIFAGLSNSNRLVRPEAAEWLGSVRGNPRCTDPHARDLGRLMRTGMLVVAFRLDTWHRFADSR
jgi:hypothetical protein